MFWEFPFFLAVLLESGGTMQRVVPIFGPGAIFWTRPSGPAEHRLVKGNADLVTQLAEYATRI